MNLLTPQSIAAMYTPKGVKPPRWFNQMYGDAFPEMTAAGRGFWRGCLSFVPMWSGTGVPEDLGSLRHSLTISGAQWSLGELGRNIDFQGASDLVDFGSKPFESLTLFSVIAVVRVDAVTANQTIVGAIDSSNNGWVFQIDNDDFTSGNTDTFVFHASRGDSRSQAAAASNTITAGQWAVLGARFFADASNALIELFKDGVQLPQSTLKDGSTTLGGSSLGATTCQIGNTDGYAGVLDGQIALVAMWDRDLSDDEFSVLGRDPFAMLRPALV